MLDRLVKRHKAVFVFMTRPGMEEFHAMLRELAGEFGWHHTAALLGISVLTMDSWRRRKNGPCASSQKLVWLTWALLLHPDHLSNAFDLATWGRFRATKQPGQNGRLVGSPRPMDFEI